MISRSLNSCSACSMRFSLSVGFPCPVTVVHPAPFSMIIHHRSLGRLLRGLLPLVKVVLRQVAKRRDGSKREPVEGRGV